MQVKVSGFFASWGFSEKSGHYHDASAYLGEFIWYCEKVVSTGFGIPTFHADGTPIGTKYIFQEGFLWERTKTKMDVGMWPSATRTGWENHPAKPRGGFDTKRDALTWEREFLQKYFGSLDMTFNSFYEVYRNDLQNRIRQNT